MRETVEAALASDGEQSWGEQSWVDFKREFDPSSAASWCEIVKDIVAMANSGGGFIVIGLENDGLPSTAKIDAAIALDPATITDKVRKYTGVQLGTFSLHPGQKAGHDVQVIKIEAVKYPIVFTNVGSYELPNKKQERAFSVGQVYFRHGAKSEPGTGDDLRLFVDREVSQIREEWLGNVRKVVEAPAGSTVTVAPAAAEEPAIAARLVNVPDAVAVAWRSPDVTHPYRQKEALIEINHRIEGMGRVTSFDFQVARRSLRIDEDPNLIYKPKFGSCQYSTAFVDWVVGEFEKDPRFFLTLREKARESHA
jgi:hypothetical protein